MFIAALFGCFRIPVDFKDFFRNGISFQIGNPYVVLFYDGNFTVVHDISLARIAQNGWNIRGDIVFAFAEADDKGIVFFAANDLIRFKTAHEHEGIRAAQPGQHALYSPRKVAVIHVSA